MLLPHHSHLIPGGQFRRPLIVPPPVGGTRLQPTVTHLETAQNSADQSTPYATGSVSVATNEVVFLLANGSQTGATCVVPSTVSGAGLSLDKIAEVLHFDATSPSRSLSLWRGRPAAPFTGTLSIDHGGAAMTSVGWTIVKCGQVDLTGSNGAGAVAQTPKTATSANANVTQLTATLDNPLENALNVLLAFVGTNAAAAVTQSPGFAELGDGTITSPTGAVESSHLVNVNTATPTWASAMAGLVIVEVKGATV